jgi:hypothetical protein
VVLTGYRDATGLSVSLLSLVGSPQLVDTQVLEGRYEAENRSHAFNALVGAEGDGLMGLATIARRWESGRWVWRSQASDVSFLSVDDGATLASLGALEATDERNGLYRCEVSCVDWYGNTRALFIGSRVFALSATELIEGQVSDGAMAELRRVNLSVPPPK